MTMPRWKNTGARFTAEDGPRAGERIEEGEAFHAPIGSKTVRRRRHKLVRAGPDPDRQPDPLHGIPFGSDVAREAAEAQELTADDFRDVEPSGVDGFLVSDVEEAAGG